MGITCVIIAGALWVSADGYMVQPVSVYKTPDHDMVYLYLDGNKTIRAEIGEQHQLRMGTEEFVSDCVMSGYSIPEQELVPYDDIDEEECTGVGDVCLP